MIIEAALLTDDEKVTACTLAKAAGADYVKTSTGFGPGGATAADVALMRRVVGAEMGVKAAGGVRDLEGLKAMVAAGATRVGASAGVKIVQQARGENAGAPSAQYEPGSTEPAAGRRSAIKKPCRDRARARDAYNRRRCSRSPLGAALGCVSRLLGASWRCRATLLWRCRRSAPAPLRRCCCWRSC